MASPDPADTREDSEEFETAFFQAQGSPPLGTRTPPLGTHTPPRAMSSSSLYGEDIVGSSSRPSSGPTDQDFLFSPSMLSEATTPPSVPQNRSLSPPPLNGENFSWASAATSKREEIVSASRPSSAPTDQAFMFSPSMLSEATTPPSVQQVPSLSPPPLNGENVSWASAATSKRRPPRAPNVNLRFGGGSTGGGIPKQQSHHNRALSGGDASFLSALTDTDYEVGLEALKGNMQHQQPSHTRHISWDQQDTFPAPEVRGMDIDFALDLQQPILDDVLDIDPSEDHDEVEKPIDQPVPKGSRDPPVSLRQTHLLKLSEFKEFEAEAETLILKSIEEESASVFRQTSMKSVIYPTIPEDGADRFEENNPEASPRTGIVRSSSKSLDSFTLAAVAVRLQALRETVAAANGVSESATVSRDADNNAPASSSDQFDATTNVLMATARLRRKAAGTTESVETVKYSSTVDGKDACGSTEEKATSGDDIETGRQGKAVFLRHLAESAATLPSKVRTDFARTAEALREDWALFGDFMRPQKASVRVSIRQMLLYAILPSLALAFILYYGADNPPTGKREDKGTPLSSDPSTSWWVIFLGVRQILVLALAHASEFVLVNYAAAQSPLFIRMAGPKIALLCSISKGWPCILFFLGLYNIFFLYGNTRFKRHWLFWQDFLDIFNETNPAGNVTNDVEFLWTLLSFLLVGLSVSVKRLWTGHHLGRRLFVRYHIQLAEVMEKMLLVTEVALLCRYQSAATDEVSDFFPSQNMDLDTPEQSLNANGSEDVLSYEPSTRLGIMDLLEHWEEPQRASKDEMHEVSVTDLLQFRQSCRLMETDFPFSPAFGLASTRTNCIKSAEKLYGKILKRQNKSDSRDVLNFETLSAIALEKDSSLDQAKVKKLSRVFRPSRNGELSVLDWCKSCDAVYKEMRFLSSSIHNASQIDRAYERILNIAFYTFLTIVVFAMLGVSALSFVLSLSSIMVAFAFMIGPASSTYFDGILLILARRPFDIGDRIAVSAVDTDTNSNGSPGWVVEKIDLFTTTVRFGSTREVATLSNGSLARSRIINMTRSDKAQVFVYLKFSVDEPYSKVKVFRSAVESFVRERPREWLCLSGFRATRVETDLGYIEYVVVLQHRESWNMVTEILQSKADVSSFCLELQKQLEMRYHAPALPVDLAMNMTGKEDNTTKVATSENTPDKSPPLTPGSRETMDDNVRAIARMFESKKAK